MFLYELWKDLWKTIKVFFLSYLLNFGTAKCLLIIIWSSALFIAKKSDILPK